LSTEFHKFIRKRSQQHINDMAGLYNIRPPSFPDVDVITFTNQDKTKGRLSNGQEVDTIPIGQPRNTDIGYRMDGNSYAVQREPVIKQFSDGGNTQCFAFDFDPSEVKATLYAMHLGSSAVLPIPQDLKDMSTTDNGNWSAGFTPSGKHIVFTIIENNVDSTLKTTTGLTAHWIYYKNFTLDNQGSFSIGSSAEGSAVLTGLITEPSSPSITWSNTQVLTSLVGNGTATFTLEDDPNFPENNEIAYTIDVFPESDNDYNSGNESHNVISVFYEEADDDGVLQPAVDFIGSVVAYKRLTKVKRVLEVSGEDGDGHTVSAQSSFTSTASSRAFYMDVDRVANVHVTLTSTYPYANTPFSVSTVPGDLEGQWSSGSASTIFMNIWGVGNQYYLDGPDCDDTHQHTNLDTLDAGSFPSQNFVTEKLGTYVESLGLTVGTPVDQKVTFDYKTIVSPGSCTTGTQTTDVGINYSQSVYKQETNQLATVFWYSANSGTSSSYVDVDSASAGTGYVNENLISAFRSSATEGDEFVALRMSPPSTSPLTGSNYIVQGDYLDQTGTDVDNIVAFGTLAYNDREILDLLTFSEFDNDVFPKVIDSSTEFPVTLLSIESIESGTRWKIKKWRYSSGQFSLMKSKIVTKPTIFFIQPDDYIMRN
jgi:hypothetical protein